MKDDAKKNRNLFIIGLFGLSIVFIVNLFGIFALKQVAAEFFSNQWWSTWFPAYIVWLVFLIIGIGTSYKKVSSNKN